MGGCTDYLAKTFYKYPALQPRMPFIDDKAPGKVRKVKALWMPDGYYLFWLKPKPLKNEKSDTQQYVVYRFKKGEKVNLENPAHIVAITDQNCLKLPYMKGKDKYIYYITALDRLHNESKEVKKSIKL